MAVETKVYSDSEVVELYREWSESTFSASFMGADDDYQEYVAEFREWLEVKESLPALLLVYEQQMLAEYRKQDARSAQQRLRSAVREYRKQDARS
jgi:hypothetical protein